MCLCFRTTVSIASAGVWCMPAAPRHERGGGSSLPWVKLACTVTPMMGISDRGLRGECMHTLRLARRASAARTCRHSTCCGRRAHACGSTPAAARVKKNGARERRLAHWDIAAVVATDDDFPLEVEDEDGRRDH